MVVAIMSKQTVSALLHGRSLTWSCYDPSGVVCDSIRTMLQEQLRSEAIRPRLMAAATHADVLPRSTDIILGLAIWRIGSVDELTAIGTAVQECHRRQPNSVRMVYCQPGQQSRLSVLHETASQLIFSSVPSLQSVVLRITPMLSLSEKGYHPLTSSLRSRLPLPEPDPAIERSTTQSTPRNKTRIHA